MSDLLPSATDDVERLRPFAAIRLIAADLDGTLYPSPLFERIQRSQRSLNYYGVRLTVATGRTFRGVHHLIEQLKIRSDTPLVLYNGGVVRTASTGKILRRSEMSQGQLQKILAYAAGFTCEVFAYIHSSPLDLVSHMGVSSERVIGWRFGSSTEPRPVYEFNGALIHWQRNESEVLVQPSAVLVRSLDQTELSALNAKLAMLADASVTRSGPVYFEIRPSQSDKAIGLNVAAKYLNISKDEILALGDNDNDAEMLRWAGIGVAIAGASEAAISNSDYICRRSVFQGAVEVLDLVRRAHRYFGKRTFIK